MEKQKITSADNLIPVFCDCIKKGQSVRFSPKGVSMLPFIREGKDSVVISPISEKLEKYDVVLYKRDNGQYVLHRITEIGDSYTLMGDNQFVKETGILPEQIIAVMTSFQRGSKMYSKNNIVYKMYCRLWHHSRRVRRFIKRGFGWLKRHIGG